MDGVGIRPTLVEHCERLAEAGYFTLLPDLFYRSGSYEPQDPAKLFADPAVRGRGSPAIARRPTARR
ncbi:dienelactone hydrolase family protein [Nannocystis pusilla]|uniref:dienelactone hydrolase family protein n=1 Tax=Nannocystis pusilla TaxID=889268 RepID=UPI003B7F4BB5